MMRDTIAKIISDDVDAHLNSGIPWDATKAADAIINALPDMIPDWRTKTMSDELVKRYQLDYHHTQTYADMIEDFDGDWVKYKDNLC